MNISTNINAGFYDFNRYNCIDIVKILYRLYPYNISMYYTDIIYMYCQGNVKVLYIFIFFNLYIFLNNFKLQIIMQCAQNFKHLIFN